jgi:hypothetical protein
MKNTRTIHNKEIGSLEPNKWILHPITCEIIDNKTNKPLCITKPYLNDYKNIKFIKNGNCNKNMNINDYKKFLYIPTIGLNSVDILKLYNIDTVDNLENWINTNINDKSYYTTNRIFNCWIRINYSTLIEYNKILVKIIKKIIINYKSDEIKKIVDLDKEISNFIDYWINKNSENEYRINLIDDFRSIIKKKYNK